MKRSAETEYRHDLEAKQDASVKGEKWGNVRKQGYFFLTHAC